MTCCHIQRIFDRLLPGIPVPCYKRKCIHHSRINHNRGCQKYRCSSRGNCGSHSIPKYGSKTNDHQKNRQEKPCHKRLSEVTDKLTAISTDDIPVFSFYLMKCHGVHSCQSRCNRNDRNAAQQKNKIQCHKTNQCIDIVYQRIIQMKLQHKPPLQTSFPYLMRFTSIVIPAIITNITLRNGAKHHVPIFCASIPKSIGVSMILRYENVICIPMTDCEDSSPNN